MEYRINIIPLEKGSNSFDKQQLRVSTEAPLTVAQAKQQCFAKLAMDEEKYTKGAEEIWTKARNSAEYTALADETVLSEKIHASLEYYITVTKK